MNGGGDMGAPQWAQPGFAVISDGSPGLPMSHGFHLTRWEAEGHMAKLETLRAAAIGTPLEEALAGLRVVPATLSFADTGG